MSLTSPHGNSIVLASQEAITSLTALSNSDDNLGPEEHPATEYRYSDEIDRLQIWMNEHSVRSGRLDYKLREASHLHDRVLSLLTELTYLGSRHGTTDNSASTGVQDDGSNRSSTVQRTGKTNATSNPVQSPVQDDQSDGSTSSSIDTSFTPPDSLPDSPLNRTHDVITLLNELGPTLKDPVPHNRFEQPSHPEGARQDINHIREWFSKADDLLIDRLGRANWERRQNLRKLRSAIEENPYRIQKLEATEHILQNVDLDLSDSDSATDDSDESVSGTDKSISIESNVGGQEISMPASRALTATISTQSDFQFSLEETQSTAPTEQSLRIPIADASARPPPTRYRVPRPPSPNEGLTGKTFLCPFCSHMVSDMKKPSEWKKHIFEDLEPYMCTYRECLLGAKTYGSRKLWWEHETERHRVRRSWVCTPCEQKQQESVFDTPTAFENHIVSQHTIRLTPIALQKMRDLCERDVGVRRPSNVCPLCRDTITPKGKSGPRALERAVRKHVADHLEQLAYFVAFPAGQMLLKDDESEFQDDSDSEDGLQSEIRSIISRDTRVSKKDVQIENVKTFIADQKRAADDNGESTAARVPIPKDGSAQATQQNRRQSVPLPSAHAMTPEFPILILMHPPNEHFYSRQKLLSEAGKALRLPGSICIFHGVGGVGKTKAAVQYIYTEQQQYDAIFWLQADTVPGLTDSYLQMAMALGIANNTEDQNQVIDKGRDWLQQTERRWLLVFDNVLRWMDISRYLPNHLRRTKGSVLITTQAENILPKAENVTKLRLDPLNQQAGAEMLLRYLDRDVRADPERHLALEISAFVGGLPVAISQIAGYISYSQYTLEELIETFRQWRKRTGVATDEADDLPVAFREASFTYEGALQMVWEVTLRELTEDARDIINLLAYLNCGSVPQDMLWRMHEDEILQFLDPREKIRMRRINESLVRRRLVSLDADSCFSMHRSLQRGIRERLSQDRPKQQKTFNQAVALVREVFPRSNPLQQPMPEKWSECQKLLPHLHALHDVYHGFKPHIEGSLEFAQLLLDAGMDQFEQGITHEGLLLLNTAEIVLDASSPEHHQVMKADIHAMIGIMYDNRGIEQRQESFKRRENALKIRQRVFEDADTPKRQDEMLLYNSWMEYAISWLHYHQYEEAEPIIEKCLVKYTEWGSEDEIPFEYAKYYNKIALVRMYQGRFDAAISLASHGVQLMDQAGYHLFAGRFRFDLACIILQSGDLDRALKIHQEIHDQRMEKVGQTNELSLHSMYAIAAILELKGDYDGAETWLRKVLDQRRSVTSWPDEAFSRAQFHLSRVLVARGKAEDIDTANSLREKALAVLHRLLPLDFPEELKGVTDEAILFDHMLPISPGGPRFTGRGLLECFMPKP